MVALPEPDLWVEPVQVYYGDVWQLGPHRLMCGDATNADEVDRLLQGEKPDLIFADPPYGIGIDDWDVAIPDVPGFIALITSHLKQGGFFAFTHQMPYMVDWLYALKHSRLRYKDHIAWVKRIATTPGSALMRSHESLFIYAYGRAKYYVTTGLYTDVKVPGLLFDTSSIEGIQSHINDLRAKLNGDPYRKMVHHPDSKYAGYKGYNGVPAVSDRSAEFVNFTNVWSFSPNRNGRTMQHVTGKPILLMNRLLELCTPENALVYDAFLGSGTTLIAGQNTKRAVYGMELSPTYCSNIIQRWQYLTGHQATCEKTTSFLSS